jgi:DNA-binding transcriptional LysR family regulator
MVPVLPVTRIVMVSIPFVRQGTMYGALAILKWPLAETQRPRGATLMDLNALRDFLAVTEHGGYAEAGRVLGLPKSTLSRRVAALERSLGVRLLDRNSRRLRLTAEGGALRDRATGLVASLMELEEQLRPEGAPLSGRVRISVPVLFGHVFLGQIAARFAALHPGLVLEAAVEDRRVDLLRDGFDAALRINPIPDGTLSGRLLGRNRLLLVVAPPLAEHLGYKGRSPQNLVWPAVVRQGWGSDGGWSITGPNGPARVLADLRLSLSSPLAIRDAVVAGAGAALLPASLVRQDLADGRLISLGERNGGPEEVWIVHASGRLPSRRLRALIDTMVSYFAEEPILG